MFVISNDELKNKNKLGDFILCKHCGKRHKVGYGEEILKDGTKKPSKILAFYKCGEDSFLVGINGKDIRK